MRVLAIDGALYDVGLALVEHTHTGEERLLWHAEWNLQGETYDQRICNFDRRIRIALDDITATTPLDAIIAEEFLYVEKPVRILVGFAGFRAVIALLANSGYLVQFVSAVAWQRDTLGRYGQYAAGKKRQARTYVEQVLHKRIAWDSRLSNDGTRGGHDSDAAAMGLWWLSKQHILAQEYLPARA